jgi:hypothetical protein
MSMAATSDLSHCPHCGRATATVGRGSCAECWKARVPGGQAVIQDPGPRTQRIFDFDWLNMLPEPPWLILAGAAVVAIIAVVVGIR